MSLTFSFTYIRLIKNNNYTIMFACASVLPRDSYKIICFNILLQRIHITLFFAFTIYCIIIPLKIQFLFRIIYNNQNYFLSILQQIRRVNPYICMYFQSWHTWRCLETAPIIITISSLVSVLVIL